MRTKKYRLSILIPTLGREELRRAVRSALISMGPEDELLVVADGPTRMGRRIMEEEFDPRTRLIETVVTHSWGTAQLDIGIALATGDWCIFLPDDDYMPFYACTAIRRHVEGTKGVHVFSAKMNHWGGRILSNSQEAGAVTGSQIVWPRETHAYWSDSTRQLFDWDFLQAALRAWDQREPWYHDDIISISDQQNNGQ